LREKDFVAFPPVWKKEKCLAVYSGKLVEKTLAIPSDWGDVRQVSIYQIKPDGEIFYEIRNIENGTFRFDLESGQPYLIKPGI
jgi:hypothetical protein